MSYAVASRPSYSYRPSRTQRSASERRRDALQVVDPHNPTPEAASLADFLRVLDNLTLIPHIRIDLRRGRVSVDKRECHLADREYALLAYLAAHAGTVVSRSELRHTVWHDADVDAHSRTIDVHVRRLRAKTGQPGLITTVRGRGYRLNAGRGVDVLGADQPARPAARRVLVASR